MENDKEILSDLSPKDLQNLQKELEKKIQVLERQNAEILEEVPNLSQKLEKYSAQPDFERPRYVGQHAFDLLSTEMKRVIGGKAKSLTLTKAERIAKLSTEKRAQEIQEYKQTLFAVERELRVRRIIDLDQGGKPEAKTRKNNKLPDYPKNWESEDAYPIGHTKTNAARIWGVQRSTVYRWISDKIVTPLPTGRISIAEIKRLKEGENSVSK